MRNLLLVCFLILSIHAKSQIQSDFLGKSQKEVVEILSEDENIVFDLKGQTNNSKYYMSYKSAYPDYFTKRAYYFDEKNVCFGVRCMFANKELSKHINEIKKSKIYESIGDYTWKSKKDNHYMKINFIDDLLFEVEFTK